MRWQWSLVTNNTPNRAALCPVTTVIASGLVTCYTYAVAAMEVAVRVGKHLRSRRMPWQALCHILNQRGFTNGIRVLVLGRSTLTLEWGSAKHPERTSATHVAKTSVTQRNHEPVSSMKRTAAVSWSSTHVARGCMRLVCVDGQHDQVLVGELASACVRLEALPLAEHLPFA